MIMCIQNFVSICSFILKKWSKNQILTSVKGYNSVTNLQKMIYRPTSICQTCLSRKHHLCRSDCPFLNFFPIFYCISTLFVSNWLMTKTQVYRSDFSFPWEVFHQFYHWICRSQNVYRNRLAHAKTYFGHHFNLSIITLINF